MYGTEEPIGWSASGYAESIATLGFFGIFAELV
jgi:hypothetical protein